MVNALGYAAPPTLTVTRFLIDPPAGESFPGANAIPRYAVSPDGRSVAFASGRPGAGFQLWIRRLDSVDAQPLRLTQAPQDSSIQGMFWFRTIGFFDEQANKLKKVDVQTGAVQALVDVPSNQLAGSANEEGTIIYSAAATKGIMRVSSAGGTPVQVTTLDPAREELMHLWPRFLPGRPPLSVPVRAGRSR